MRRRRFPPGLLASLAAGALAGAVSLAVQGLSLAAFLLPFLLGVALAGGLLFLLGLVRHAQALKGSRLLAQRPYSREYTTFEGGCLGLLAAMGFQVQEVRALPQGGIRVQADNPQTLLQGRYIIHCMESQEPLDALLVGALYAEVLQGRAHKGLYLTDASFTPTAIEFASGRNVELIDGARLDGLLRTHGAAPPAPLDRGGTVP
ncbi:MAG: restriction endonuclease [Chloroflexi bacterium]|nr:restriction endonuclease [Chloroflexota bacterium]